VERPPLKPLQQWGGLSNTAKVFLVVAALLAYPICFFWSLFVVYDELPAAQEGVGGESLGSALDSNGNSCGGVVVFGHRASQPRSANDLTPTSAPGSAAAVAWLAEKGICAYDVDCFEVFNSFVALLLPPFQDITLCFVLVLLLALKDTSTGVVAMTERLCSNILKHLLFLSTPSCSFSDLSYV